MSFDPTINKFIRVEPDDPSRCQAVHANQQCPFKAVGDSKDGINWVGPKYCPRHGGNKGLAKAKQEEKEMYLLAKWNDRIGHHATHPRIKTLANEIGIVRMLIEQRLNQIKDEKELVLHAAGIVNLTNSVRDMMKTWQHIEERSGQVIDRAKMGLFVQDLIEILSRYIGDPDILQMIGEDISESIDRLMQDNTNEQPRRGNEAPTG